MSPETHDGDELDPVVVRRLESERPLPDPEFRQTLGRHVRSEESALPVRRRAALLTAAGGIVLLAVGVLSVLGAGPLAA